MLPSHTPAGGLQVFMPGTTMQPVCSQPGCAYTMCDHVCSNAQGLRTDCKVLLTQLVCVGHLRNLECLVGGQVSVGYPFTTMHEAYAWNRPCLVGWLAASC